MGKKCNRPLRSVVSNFWSLRGRLLKNFWHCGTGLASKGTDGPQPPTRDTKKQFARSCSRFTTTANCLRRNTPDTTVFGRSNSLPTKNEMRRERFDRDVGE